MMHGRLANVSHASGTSAYPQEAGAMLHCRRRRKCATSGREQLQQVCSLDHIVGAGEQRRRNVELERSGTVS